VNFGVLLDDLGHCFIMSETSDKDGFVREALDLLKCDFALFGPFKFCSSIRRLLFQRGAPMPLTEAEIEKRLGNDGPFWRPDQDKKLQLHSLDGFAVNFLCFFKPIFGKVAAKRAPKITTHMAFVDKDTLNAFAYDPTDSDYLICLNRGLIHKVREAIYSPSGKKLLAERFPKIHKIDPTFLPLTASYLAITFAFFHEFAHVFRGHLGYLHTVKLDEDTVLEMAGSQLNPAKTKARYLVECDADTWGGYLTAPSVWQTIETVVDRQDSVLHPGLAEEAIALAGFAIGLFFRIMEATGRPTALYPPHVVRSAIVQTQMMLGLEELEKKSRMLSAASIRDSVVAGMAFGNALAKELQLAEAGVDAKAAAEAWVKDDAPAVNALAETLKQFVP
jgi:hypothetical protein